MSQLTDIIYTVYYYYPSCIRLQERYNFLPRLTTGIEGIVHSGHPGCLSIVHPLISTLCDAISLC